VLGARGLSANFLRGQPRRGSQPHLPSRIPAAPPSLLCSLPSSALPDGRRRVEAPGDGDQRSDKKSSPSVAHTGARSSVDGKRTRKYQIRFSRPGNFRALREGVVINAIRRRHGNVSGLGSLSLSREIRDPPGRSILHHFVPVTERSPKE
jgi:hypothetical protein